MSRKDFTYLFVAAVCLASAPSNAQPQMAAPTEEGIHALLDRGDVAEAARRIDRLIESRLQPRTPLRPDPVLDRLVGEILADTMPDVGRELLARSVASRSIPHRARYQLSLADAYERLGEFDRAEAVYRAVLAESELEPAQRRRATIGLAGLLLLGRPADALREAASHFESAGERSWELALLASRAARMLGREAEASAYLETASQLAWSAPYGDAAVARIALDRGAVAGQRGDRQTLIALTALVQGGPSGYDGATIRASPECGSQNVAEDDFAVIELRAGAGERLRAGIILVSRPEVARPFIEAAQRGAVISPDRQAVSLLLRCTLLPPSESVTFGDPGNPIQTWASARGAYPIMGTTASEFASAAARLAEREGRLGPDSPFLIPVLNHLLMTSGQAFVGEATDARERVLGYAQRLEALLVAHDANADARLQAGMIRLFLELAMERKTQNEAAEEMRTRLAAAATDSSMSAQTLFALGSGLSRMPPITREFEATTLTQILAATAGRVAADDPRRRALAIRLYQLRVDMGDEARAQAIREEFRFPNGLCALATTRPRYLSSDIRAEDYPEDSMGANLRGTVTLELSLDAAGKAERPRIVGTSLPFVFDEVTVTKSSTIRYEPARVTGQPAACRGVQQPLRWQLAY